MCQTIRVLNAVREYTIGIPLTLKQYPSTLHASSLPPSIPPSLPSLLPLSRPLIPFFLPPRSRPLHPSFLSPSFPLNLALKFEFFWFSKLLASNWILSMVVSVCCLSYRNQAEPTEGWDVDRPSRIQAALSPRQEDLPVSKAKRCWDEDIGSLGLLYGTESIPPNFGRPYLILGYSYF